MLDVLLEYAITKHSQRWALPMKACTAVKPWLGEPVEICPEDSCNCLQSVTSKVHSINQEAFSNTGLKTRVTDSVYTTQPVQCLQLLLTHLVSSV